MVTPPPPSPKPDPPPTRIVTHNPTPPVAVVANQNPPPPMRPDSPRSNLVLPPPLARPSSSSSHSTRQVKGEMTLPPLSTVSPLSRPGGETAAFSLSNLIHQPLAEESKKRDRREIFSPGPSPSRSRLELESESEPGLSISNRPVRARHSLPERHERANYDQPPPRVYDVPPPVQRTYEPRRPIVHPTTATATATAPRAFRPEPTSARTSHPPPQQPQWTIHPTPHPYPPYRTSGGSGSSTASAGHRRSSSIAEAWFAVGDLPPRQQYGWSRDRVEGYHAGWEDALRSVEAGVFGVGGQQYLRPILVRKDIPPPHTVLGPPPLRQSSSSDPGPYIPMTSHPQPSGSGTGPFEPPPIHPRSISFSSHPPPPQQPFTYRRPATAATTTTTTTVPHNPGAGAGSGYFTQRHSYSSTSMSPTSPSSTGERKHRQAISCYPCRGRKLKCDGEKPCSQCVRRGGSGDCEYASSVRRRGKGKKGKSLDGEEGEGEDDDSVSVLGSQEGE